MRISEILTEFIIPAEELRSQIYYHGTGNTKLAESILQNGLQPGNTTGKARGHLTPVSGAVYLTDNLRYAVIYALGGDMLGHQGEEGNQSLIARSGGDPFCYVFVIPGNRLQKVQPDEDSVGEAVQYAYDIVEKAAKGKPYYGDSRLYQALLADPVRARQFLYLGKRAMTPKQYRETVQGFIAYHAAGGKRVLKMMPEWMKSWLIQNGSHTAHFGLIEPTECWRFDRRLNPQLQRDASNFFDLAERIR